MVEPVIIVLGASGRVGQELLPLLPNSDNVLAVSRMTRSRSCSAARRWLHVDLSAPDAVVATISRLDTVQADSNVIVVDLVLDRTSVTTMRRSIAASTRYVLDLTERLRTSGRTCGVVCASTTAVLAPTFYQTPYGHAKHDQLTSYARLQGTTAAYLLPQLVASPRDTATDATWTYRQAARELANGARQLQRGHPPTFRLVSPRPSSVRPAPTQSWPRNLLLGLPIHLMAWTTRRDRPEAHRAASHTRLSLTPRALRRRVDHHTIPLARVHQLTNRLDATLTWLGGSSLAAQRKDSDPWVP